MLTLIPPVVIIILPNAVLARAIGEATGPAVANEPVNFTIDVVFLRRTMEATMRCGLDYM